MRMAAVTHEGDITGMHGTAATHLLLLLLARSYGTIAAVGVLFGYDVLCMSSTALVIASLASNSKHLASHS